MTENEVVLTEWTKKSLGYDPAERCLEQLLLCGDVGITGLFAQTLRTPAKQGGCESLGDGKGEKEDHPSKDHVDPNDPSPANRLTNEAANNGSKYRTTVGAAAKSAIANPRSLLSQTSDIVPPASVRGAEAKIPQKKRQMRSVWIFLATAQGMLKMT